MDKPLVKPLFVFLYLRNNTRKANILKQPVDTHAFLKMDVLSANLGTPKLTST